MQFHHMCRPVGPPPQQRYKQFCDQEDPLCFYSHTHLPPLTAPNPWQSPRWPPTLIIFSLQECYINGIRKYEMLRDWLFFSLSIIPLSSKLLHVLVYCSFLLLSRIPWYRWTAVLFNCLPAMEHLNCFQLLAAMNIYVQVLQYYS